MVALSRHREEIQSALDRVTGSAAFRSSKRSQSFLRYVVEVALAGESDLLKEQSIGTAVFGREPGYDTGADAIVRVTAHDVRRRLASYYEQENPAEPVIFELRAGSYIPEIRLTAANPDSGAPEAVGEPEHRLRPTFWRVAALAGWSLALLFALVWMGKWLAARESPHARALRQLPWVALFDGGKSPAIVMADSAMGGLRILDGFSADLESYAYRRFLSPPPHLQPDLHKMWRSLARKEYTSLADARVAAAFALLTSSAGRKPVIRFAREMQLSDFRRGENLFLLGSVASNPWVDLFLDRLDFQIRFDTLGGHSVNIRKLAPGDPRELAGMNLTTTASSGTTGEAYASLALVTGLDGRGKVLIAQGTNMEGTELAAGLALDPTSLVGQLESCGIDPTNPTANFEVLLRLDTTASSVRNWSVLASRCYPEAGAAPLTLATKQSGESAAGP